MKRYFDKGEGFNFEGDDEDEVENEDIIDIDADDVMDAMKLDLVESHLNQRLLEQAVGIAKNDWLWFFRSPSFKTKAIEKVYKKLLKLMEEE